MSKEPKARELRVSPTLSLPESIVTERDAILAVSGAGKSNAARVMAEELFGAGLPFCAIDPKGDWWGLRSGRDGTPKGGLDVVIFGGPHGDVPLERGSGAFVADLVSRERLSSVLDLRGFPSKAARKAFLHDFGERLYQKNQDPLKLFFDEADDYLPQKPMKDELRLLSVYEDIVRRGRTKGLGITLVTQRSAVVNKNVLTQCETVYVLRTTGPQDVKAVEAWMQYHGGDRTLLSTLATLESGEAWVWSPFYLKKMERFRFRLSHTFDSGATPTNYRSKTARRPATLSDLDVTAIRAQMAETVARVEAEDPRRLRERVAELEKQLKAAAARGAAAAGVGSKVYGLGSGSGSDSELNPYSLPPTPRESASDLLPWRQWVGQLRAELEVEQRRSEGAIRRAAELEAALDRLHQGLEELRKWDSQRPPPWAPPRTTQAEIAELAAFRMPGESSGPRLKTSGAHLNGKAAAVEARQAAHVASVKALSQAAVSTVMTRANGSPPKGASSPSPRSRSGSGSDLTPYSLHPTPREAASARESASELSAGELRVLGALGHHGGTLPRTRLALVTGYQHTAGGFATTLGALRAEGFIEGRGDPVLTDRGREAARGLPPPLSGKALRELWERKLGGTARRILGTLLEAERPLSLGELAARTLSHLGRPYTAGAGGFAEGLAELRRYALVEGSAKALTLGDVREAFL